MGIPLFVQVDAAPQLQSAAVVLSLTSPNASSPSTFLTLVVALTFTLHLVLTLGCMFKPFPLLSVYTLNSPEA